MPQRACMKGRKKKGEFIMKKLTALMLSMIMILGIFAGCANDDGPAGAGDGKDPLTGIAYSSDTTFDYLYSAEITTMNYLTTSVTANQKSLANFVDTLIEFDCYGNIQPCLAESWEVSDDGLTWTFKIRKGVKWYDCDGKEVADVTANDFVYAARLVANPEFDSDMPDMLISYVENGIKLYNWSDESAEPDFTTLGVEATDDYTLVYHLTSYTA